MTYLQLQWQSTEEERYDTDMLKKARAHFKKLNLVEVESYGGTMMDALDCELASDNGFVVRDDADTDIRFLKLNLDQVIGHDIKVTDVSRDFR